MTLDRQEWEAGATTSIPTYNIAQSYTMSAKSLKWFYNKVEAENI